MKRKTAVSVIAVIMAFLLLVSLLLSVVGSIGALAADDYQSEIDAIEQQKEQLQAEREGMQADIAGLMAERETVLEKKALLDEQNQYAVEEMELIDEQIEIYTGLIEDKAEELEWHLARSGVVFAGILFTIFIKGRSSPGNSVPRERASALEYAGWLDACDGIAARPSGAQPGSGPCLYVHSVLSTIQPPKISSGIFPGT